MDTSIYLLMLHLSSADKCHHHSIHLSRNLCTMSHVNAFASSSFVSSVEHPKLLYALILNYHNNLISAYSLHPSVLPAALGPITFAISLESFFPYFRFNERKSWDDWNWRYSPIWLSLFLNECITFPIE